MATDWEAREKELNNKYRSSRFKEAQVSASLKREQEAEAKMEGAKGAASLGAAGNYSPEFQQKYADLIAKGSTLDAQELLSNQMGGQFMDERNDPAYVPERVNASTVSGLATYDATDPGQAREFAAAQADAPKDVHVGALNPVERVESRDVAGPGTASIAGMERVNAAALDTGKADQVRGAEDRYLSALEGRAAGNAPSVAENSYNSKMADVSRNAMGIAGQARGSDKAYARLKAMETIGDNTRKAAFESAQLRAGEMAQASDALGSSLSRVRGADLGQADLAAKLKQEASLANQRTSSQTEQFNSAAINQRGEFATGVDERNAQRALTASGANADAGNARTMSEAQMRADVAAGNVGRTQQNAQFNAGAQTGAAAANAAAANTRGDTTAAAKTAAAAANAKAENERLQLNAGQTQGAATTNQGAGLTAAQLEAQRKAGLAGNALTATGQAMGGETAKHGAPKGPSTGDRVLGAVTTLGAAALPLLSDERVKKNVHDVPDDAAARLAKALDFKEFEYKGAHDDGHQHVGVMAQDLERDPLGKKLVSEDGDGTKRVDYQGLTSLLLAAALRGRKEARR